MRSAAASACRSASKKLSVDALSPPSLPRRLRGDTNAGTSTGCSGGHDGTVDAMDGRTDGWIEGGFVEAAVGLCRTKNRTVRTQHSHAHSQHSAEYMHTAGQRQNAANTHTHTVTHEKKHTHQSTNSDGCVGGDTYSSRTIAVGNETTEFQHKPRKMHRKGKKTA